MIPRLYRPKTSDDLDALMQAKVQENRFIEYKRDLPSNKEAVIKFLADVSAFANASGGTILYGIVEDRGEPIACLGSRRYRHKPSETLVGSDLEDLTPLMTPSAATPLPKSV
jgi:predicted HTH transcriptional regulator